MTNNLVVIINSLKVPKIKKILLYEMKFLVPNYSCLQNPWLGGRGLLPPGPRSLSSVINWICWTPPEQNSWVRHCSRVLKRVSNQPGCLALNMTEHMCIALVNVIVDTLSILYKAEGMELFHFRSLLQNQHVAVLTITRFFNALLAHENCNRWLLYIALIVCGKKVIGY